MIMHKILTGDQIVRIVTIDKIQSTVMVCIKW